MVSMMIFLNNRFTWLVASTRLLLKQRRSPRRRQLKGFIHLFGCLIYLFFLLTITKTKDKSNALGLTDKALQFPSL